MSQNLTYYECHITLEGDPEHIRSDVEALHWKFSCINGDPNLGPGVKCYATKQYKAGNSVQTLKNQLLSISNLLAKSHKVLRNKIEIVIYDDRSSKVML